MVLVMLIGICVEVEACMFYQWVLQIVCEVEKIKHQQGRCAGDGEYSLENGDGKDAARVIRRRKRWGAIATSIMPMNADTLRDLFW